MFGSALCQSLDKLWPKMGNPFAIIFSLSLFLMILCLHNSSKKCYHDIGSYKLSEQHQGVQVSVARENDVSARGAATA